MDDLKSALTLFDYDPLWLESGLLTPETLRAQTARFATGEDRHTEHYRWAAFRAILNGRDSLTDGECEAFIVLAARDPDQGTARSVLVDLVTWGGLTRPQLDTLRTRPEFQDPTVRTFIEQRDMWDELERNGPTDELVARIVEGRMGSQRTVVDHPHLTETQLRVFAERGATRAVRNVATARLRQMKKGRA